MLLILAFVFLILGFFSLGMALYYGKKNGVIKVFNEVKTLEARDEIKEIPEEEYGYEDEIYENVSSEDLRNARLDESSDLTGRIRGRIKNSPDHSGKGKGRKIEGKNPDSRSAKSAVSIGKTPPADAGETVRMRAEAPDASDDETTGFMGSGCEGISAAVSKTPGMPGMTDSEETVAMDSPGESDDEETAVMVADDDDEETVGMAPDDDETVMMESGSPDRAEPEPDDETSAMPKRG